jgi:glycosyltransferase involved in cell wall biosynthesis
MEQCFLAKSLFSNSHFYWMEPVDTIVLNPHHVRDTEVIIGIPSFNEVRTISNVAATADRGLREYFPHKKPVIINADNDSPDGTREAFLSAETKAPKIYISTPKGEKGKGRNVRNLFQAAVELGAKAVVIVDADLTSFTPKWIQRLGEPLFSGFDYVSPIYERHKYDASITNHFARPLLQALYGLRISQPIGGDFGFSGKAAMAFLSENLWTERAAHFGIDIWMTTLAHLRGLRVCETFLGSCKSHRVKDPARELSTMFQDVVATMFQLMIPFEFVWKQDVGTRPSQVFGYGLGVHEKPPVPSVDVDHLYRTFLEGWSTFRETWDKVIPEPDRSKVGKLVSQAKESFYYPSELWVRILYDYAVAYRYETVPCQALLDSLIPFYYSRMLSHINKTRDMGTRECEEYLDAIYPIYEAEKSYLIKRWDGQRNNFLY